MDLERNYSIDFLSDDPAAEIEVVVPVEHEHTGRIDKKELLKVINQEAQNSEVVSPSIVLASSSSSPSSSSRSHGDGYTVDWHHFSLHCQ